MSWYLVEKNETREQDPQRWRLALAHETEAMALIHLEFIIEGWAEEGYWSETDDDGVVTTHFDGDLVCHYRARRAKSSDILLA
jgi:hypothetical protein